MKTWETLKTEEMFEKEIVEVQADLFVEVKIDFEAVDR